MTHSVSHNVFCAILKTRLYLNFIGCNRDGTEINKFYWRKSDGMMIQILYRVQWERHTDTKILSVSVGTLHLLQFESGAIGRVQCYKICICCNKRQHSDTLILSIAIKTTPLFTNFVGCNKDDTVIHILYQVR